MAIEAAKLAIDVDASDIDTASVKVKKLGDTIDKEAANSKKSLGGFGASFKGMGAGLGAAVEGITGLSLGALTGVGAVTALAGALKVSVSSAMEAEQITAQLNAVIASTGGAAGLSAGDINMMAGSLSQLSGVEDDAIVKASSVMLTFTKIGAETFPQAVEAAMNMSAALGTDLQGSIIQVGKALNDPIQGVTALRKVGVSLTEQQQELIRSMVEVGDVAGAQGVILQELGTEFGGAAAAMGDTAAGKIEKAKNAIGNLGEALGANLLPAIGGAAQAFADLLTAEERLQNSMLTTSQEVQSSTSNYQEYITQLNATAAAQGMQIDANGNLITTYNNLGQAVDTVRVANYALTEAEYNAAQSGMESIAYFGDISGALAGVATSTAEAAGSFDVLTASIVEMSSKAVGAQALQSLNAAASAGIITQDQYEQGFRDIASGILELPNSQIEASLAISDLNDAFISGKEPIDDYIASMDKIGDYGDVVTTAEKEIATAKKELETLLADSSTKTAEDQAAANTKIETLKTTISRAETSIKNASTAVETFSRQLNSMPESKSVDIVFTYTTVGSHPSDYNAPASLEQGYATGGFTTHDQSAWVGERGPERVELPAGTRIYNAQESAQMGGDGGGFQFTNYGTLVVQSTSGDLGADILRQVANA